ncbi:gamma-glutamylcyclotransferase [Ideonella paludis]|uniref:gamma-glutamylcyclotransferase n=1 Tax=Ideonella paludis TaxID=1233411 RepID=UPI00363367F3
MLIFVYGTLKEGFPNAHLNQGRRVLGHFRTVQRFPFMWCACPWRTAHPGS